MSAFEKFLIDDYENEQENNQAFLIDEEDRNKKSKQDYIKEAEVGTIIAFRLNFESNQNVKLTKVISGKIMENNDEKELFIVETRNGLKYGVPYNSVEWVKTGQRWSKEVYDEMKKGSVEIDAVISEDVDNDLDAEDVDDDFYHEDEDDDEVADDDDFLEDEEE